jgi:hypothetical protein
VIGALFLGACSVNVTHGSGHIITEDRSVSGFHAVELTALGDLTITQGDKESLSVQADDNLMKLIHTDVVNGVLKISFDGSVWSSYYVSGESIKFHLTVINLDDLRFSGAGKITVENLKTTDLSATLNGAGTLSLDNLSVDQLTVQLAGAGSLNADGKTTSQTINLSGVGSYQAADLQSTNATISLSGLGSATLWVVDNLDVQISGAGSVSYFGEPTIVKNITGLGSLVNSGTK